MPETNAMSGSLAIFSRASLMLAEADTIQKAKELKTLALTAAEWAKRKNLGNEAIQYCRSYALDAERKMGEMLALTERAKGTKGQLQGRNASGGYRALPPENSEPTLKELGISKRESSDAQKLAALPIEKFEKIKTQTARIPHVANNTGENEWYTPPEYVEAARSVMGGIDCDPASSAIANRIIKAKRFFDKEQNGLHQHWSGNVFLNPPYAQPLVAQFASEVAERFTKGEIKQACVLVNNATETAWFQKILSCSTAVCFPIARLRFLDPDGNACGAPLQGQAFIYLGKRCNSFCKTFSTFGICCHVIRPKT